MGGFPTGVRASILICLFLGIASRVVTAQPIQSPSTYPEAIGFFAQEKTIGENGAALLKTFREKIAVGDYA